MIERINLIPREDSVTKRTAVENRWFVIVLLLTFAGVIAAGVFGKVRIFYLSRHQSALLATQGLLEAERQRLTAIVSEIQQIATKETGLRVRLRALDSLEQERILWSDIMAQVSHLVPEGAWLTSLGSYQHAGGEESSRGLRFQGKALSNSRVSDLLGALEKSPHFRDVELISVKRGLYQDQEVVDFEVACRNQGAREVGFAR